MKRCKHCNKTVSGNHVCSVTGDTYDFIADAVEFLIDVAVDYDSSSRRRGQSGVGSAVGSIISGIADAFDGDLFD
jgi:hypothetical protein